MAFRLPGPITSGLFALAAATTAYVVTNNDSSEYIGPTVTASLYEHPSYFDLYLDGGEFGSRTLVRFNRSPFEAAEPYRELAERIARTGTYNGNIFENAIGCNTARRQISFVEGRDSGIGGIRDTREEALEVVRTYCTTGTLPQISIDRFDDARGNIIIYRGPDRMTTVIESAGDVRVEVANYAPGRIEGDILYTATYPRNLLDNIDALDDAKIMARAIAETGELPAAFFGNTTACYTLAFNAEGGRTPRGAAANGNAARFHGTQVWETTTESGAMARGLAGNFCSTGERPTVLFEPNP